MSPGLDGERWNELGQELTERLSHLLHEVVPPEAATHLLNAQRELLTALLLIYEYQAGGRRERTRPARRAQTARARRRVNRISVD